jgi:hypothetical protein
MKLRVKPVKHETISREQKGGAFPSRGTGWGWAGWNGYVIEIFIQTFPPAINLSKRGKEAAVLSGMRWNLLGQYELL